MQIKKIIPLLILIIGAVTFYFAGGSYYFNFEFLRSQSSFLQEFVTNHYLASMLIFIGAYIFITAFSLPIASLMTLVGGFLFGAYLGTLYTIISATIGAVLIFLAARYALSDWFGQKVEGMLYRLKDGFNQNAFSYMLTLRLIPLFPFWVVNIVPSLLSVSLSVFALSTFIGIIPASFVFNLIGAGLGEIFTNNEAFSLSSVVTPKLLLALCGLGLLALLPVLWKKLKN